MHLYESPGVYPATVTVTDEQIQQYYERNKDQFLTPETVDLQYLELTREQAESNVQVTEQALKDYFEEIKDRFQTAERRRARHILITATDGLDDAAAQKKAEELAEQANAGADFAQLAKEHSKDPGSAEQGGDLGLAERGVYVGPFEDALFGMQVGEIRGPVKTQFGYHVLKLEEIEPGHQKTFEEARAEVEDEFRRERAQNSFYEATEKLSDAAFSALTELDSVAKTMNLPLREVKGFTREGGGEFGAVEVLGDGTAVDPRVRARSVAQRDGTAVDPWCRSAPIKSLRGMSLEFSIAVANAESSRSRSRATRPVVTFLMLHRGLRPGYDYLLERKLSPIWREIQDSPLQAEVARFMDAAETLGLYGGAPVGA